MASPSIPAVLKRLGELHALYVAPSSSWWTRWDARKRALRYVTKYGVAILEHIAGLEAKAQVHAADLARARRDAFAAGRWEEGKYLRALSQWKKTGKGKKPKEPRPL